MPMRSLAISVTALAVLVLASTLAATKPGCAGTVMNGCGKFSLWIPDDWIVSNENKNVERTAYSNRNGTFYVFAGSLADKATDLSDDEMKEFVEDELEDVKVTSDKTDTLEKFNVRLMEGTGTDEGEPIVFKLLALDPGLKEAVLVVMITGYPKYMSPARDLVIDKILRSLRPL